MWELSSNMWDSECHFLEYKTSMDDWINVSDWLLYYLPFTIFIGIEL